MPLVLHKLTEKKVRDAAQAGLYGDGGGLWLQVTRTGNKSWIFRYQKARKMHSIGLGPVHTVGLAKAREKAREMREQLLDNVDLIGQRRRARAADAVTFEDATRRCYESLRHEWKNPKHGAQWLSTLQTYAFPVIGKMVVSAIDTPHVLAVLEPVWQTRTETASRVRQRIEKVLDWAKASRFRTGDNPATWRGNLDHLLARPTRLTKVENRPALPYRRIGEFMVALREVNGKGARALELAILTACRSGEVRGATWSEFDMEDRLWTIPASRMKAGKEHVVPLSDAAMALLRNLPRETSDYVFPGMKDGTVISDMTLTKVIRDMAGKGRAWTATDERQIVVHGFRSTFRDWAGETTSHPREVIEHALAHQLKDKAEAAYARGTLLDKRRALMADWARYIAQAAASATVTPLRGVA